MKDHQMKIKFLAVFLAFASSVQANALSLNGYLGAADTFGAMDGTHSDGRIQFRLGGLVEHPVFKSALISAGLGLSQRGSSVTPGAFKVTEDRIFLDLPLLVTYDLEIFRIYGGVNILTRLSSKCTTSDASIACADNATKWLVAQPLLGIESKEFYDFRVGLFYEFPVAYQKNWNQYAVGLSITRAFMHSN